MASENKEKNKLPLTAREKQLKATVLLNAKHGKYAALHVDKDGLLDQYPIELQLYKRYEDIRRGSIDSGNLKFDGKLKEKLTTKRVNHIKKQWKLLVEDLNARSNDREPMMREELGEVDKFLSTHKEKPSSGSDSDRPKPKAKPKNVRRSNSPDLANKISQMQLSSDSNSDSNSDSDSNSVIDLSNDSENSRSGDDDDDDDNKTVLLSPRSPAPSSPLAPQPIINKKKRAEQNFEDADEIPMDISPDRSDLVENRPSLEPRRSKSKSKSPPLRARSPLPQKTGVALEPRKSKSRSVSKERQVPSPILVPNKNNDHMDSKHSKPQKKQPPKHDWTPERKADWSRSVLRPTTEAKFLELLEELSTNSKFINDIRINLAYHARWKMERYKQLVGIRGFSWDDAVQLAKDKAKVADKRRDQLQRDDESSQEDWVVAYVKAHDDVKAQLTFTDGGKRAHWKQNVNDVSRNIDAILNDPQHGLWSLKGQSGDELRQDWARMILELSISSLSFRQGNYIFTGSAGVGKTKTAQVLAFMLSKLGILASPMFVEASVTELQSTYRHGSSKATERLVMKNLERIVFIDEAYRLVSDKGKDASDVVGQLVSVLFPLQGLFGLILAGYPKEMEVLLMSNAGLRRRFTYFTHLKDLTATDLTQMTLSKLEQSIADFHLIRPSPQITPEMEAVIQAFMEKKNSMPEQYGDVYTLQTFFNRAWTSYILSTGRDDLPIEVIHEMLKRFENMKRANIAYQPQRAGGASFASNKNEDSCRGLMMGCSL